MEKPTFDPGLTQQFTGVLRRSINKDGSFNPRAPGITDHKLILLARDAKLYREMLSKANTEAKKVQNLPQRVERTGAGRLRERRAQPACEGVAEPA